MTDWRLDAVAAMAAEAGALALGRAKDGFRRWEKAGGEPVCEIDLAVDTFLKARLAKIDPEAGWLSEETADDKARLAKQRVWVVDPIDGTRDYLRGRPGWAVSVALVEDGHPVLGVLEAPARGERWTAIAGEGAWRNGEPIHVTPRDAIVGARVPADQLPRRDSDLVSVPKPNSIALRIAMVAAGEADLVATMRWGHEWDIAAAVLIASEAGATITDALGVPLAFNTASAEAFGVLVTPPGIHAAAVERLAAYAAIAERVGAR
ncbi:3'(2'),5'-bisphosphate nucleotidase CysQ [Sphingomonas sp. CGMCC 1.13654]|uniref:3'(2'),5'-bisphosphate nucleotidase CysQ n=1 Tax=Sphingomonas chungangi TaxID=2683589 RepID=A0A838LC28_9SPHN|nr:3'(2'),5'-bisphosphate nucleotidase CysQ [Sphingomonas chungangi]MBA2936577.1 3'(2'),5'-bisphosphate nucleotidase CysQ [Sphingomonas chungangi]MVW55962.1 3'(2'),5'-bisphosphate nucleotidase CysQ [Sphingomonas chungangi]